MQNESETEFHRVYKVSPTQQLTKLTHLLRESGAAVLTGSVVTPVLTCHWTLRMDVDSRSEQLLVCRSLTVTVCL